MQERRRSDVIVGLFVLGAFIILQLITFLIRGNVIGGTMQIQSTFEGVSGLEVGAPVLISGVRKGRVEKIEYQGSAGVAATVNKQTGEVEKAQPVLVKMVVSSRIPMFDNATVRLVQQGFLGDKRVEIEPGTEEQGGRPISEGHRFKGEPNFNMENMMHKFEGIVENVEATTGTLREFVTKEGTMDSARSAVDNFNNFVTTAQRNVETNEASVKETMSNLAVVSANMKEITTKAKELFKEGGRVDSISAETELTIKDARARFAELADKADQTVTKLNDIMANVDQRSQTLVDGASASMDDWHNLAVNMQETSRELEIVLEKIRRGEGTVGRLVSDPEPFENLKDSIEGMRNFLLGSGSEFYDSTIPYVPARNASDSGGTLTPDG